MPIVIETQIQTAFAPLWEATQHPERHQRWDMRFSTIQYSAPCEPPHPQQFIYTTRIGFGLSITGMGETSTRTLDDGRTISALSFWSDHPLSLIRQGAGYWLYQPTSAGMHFLTRYDYQTRFGMLGQIIDRLLFRRLIAWATAWSFDRLRLWLEHEIDPYVAFRMWLGRRLALGCGIGGLLLLLLMAIGNGSWPHGAWMSIGMLLMLVGGLTYRHCRNYPVPSAQRCNWTY